MALFYFLCVNYPFKDNKWDRFALCALSRFLNKLDLMSLASKTKTVNLIRNRNITPGFNQIARMIV